MTKKFLRGLITTIGLVVLLKSNLNLGRFVQNNNLTPVILAGGQGARLWPMSNDYFPKQFLRFDQKLSLFQKTLLRVVAAKNWNLPIILINKRHYITAMSQIDEIGVKYLNTIIEPIGRDTAPAIALAAFCANYFIGRDCTLLIMPTDHIIKNVKLLINKINKINKTIIKDNIVTFGITPESANTKYGYIKCNKEISKGVFKIDSFTEKPSIEVAKKLLKSNKCYWNSGIFLMKSNTYLQELKKYSSNTYNYVKIAFERKKNKEKIKAIRDKEIPYY